jgi:hypothetical protein
LVLVVNDLPRRTGARSASRPINQARSLPTADFRNAPRARKAPLPPCSAGPQWQAAQIVDALERDSGVPAIAYSHAAFFAAFRALGVKDLVRGHGRLLASLAEPAR